MTLTIHEFATDTYVHMLGTLTHVLDKATKHAEARKVKGLRIAAEGFADRVYADDGQLVSRKLGKDALITDPSKAADQAVRMAMEGKVRTITGKVIDARVETICIHGDSPGADKIVAAVRDGLVKAGASVKPLRDWLPR